MPSIDQLTRYLGNKVLDRNGKKIGTLDDLYVDDDSGDPKWFAVSTSRFGSKLSFVPIEQSHPSGDDVQVAWTKDQVEDAPNVDPDGELSPEEEDRLFRHYGLSTGSGPGSSGDRDAEDDRPDESRSGGSDEPRRREAEAEQAGDRDQARAEPAGGDQRLGQLGAGGVRLRKYTVTEEKTITVPVEREVVEVVEDDEDQDRK